jgi:hypothetical protein
MIHRRHESRRFRCALTGESVAVTQTLSILMDERGVLGVSATPTHCSALSADCPNSCLHGAGDAFENPVDPRTGALVPAR